MIEAGPPLRVQDFDALAATADTWLDTHGDLAGVVIHARTFPGWENVASLRRHVRFVRDHHRRVRRVAVAADGRWAEVAPRLAGYVVRAEVRAFGYDDLDDAVVWSSATAPAALPGPS